MDCIMIFLAVRTIMSFTTCMSLDHTISDHRSTHRQSQRTGSAGVRSVVLPVQAIKTYRGSGSIAPLTLNHGTRWR